MFYIKVILYICISFKTKDIMKAIKFNYRGSEFNKIQFSEIEDYLIEKGLNVNAIFEMIADENEFVYVSNGFVSGLMNDNESGEWHHFFKKDVDGHFIAGKLQFTNN